MMIAASSANPWGVARFVVTGPAAAGRYRKANRTKAAKARTLSRLVRFWVKLPQRTPRHCKRANSNAVIRAIDLVRFASGGYRTPVYSPTTIEITAIVAHVESQSLQPTTNPA